MEYEYRYLSEEIAAEIDSKGFTDNLGRKIYINSGKSVTNYNETVVFQQTWFSHESEESDKYFLAYNGCYYFVDLFHKDKSEKKNCNCDYYDTYIVSKIVSAKCNKVKYQSSEILKILKDVITEWNLKISGKINEGDRIFTSLIYKGEEI